MKKRRKTALGEDVAPLQQRRLLSGPLVFLFMVFVVTVGSIECISTVRNYALSLSELHALQREESDLREQNVRWIIILTDGKTKHTLPLKLEIVSALFFPVSRLFA